MQGLDRTAALIPKIYLMQDLYLHTEPTANLPEGFISKFQETLTVLCSKILDFHARALIHFDKTSWVQYSRGAIKKDPWADLLQEMKDIELELHNFVSLFDAADSKSERQEWRMRYKSLENNMKTYKVWQKDTARDQKVNQLLRMLYTCPYRDRKDRNRDRVPGTCEWFVGNQRFQAWNQNKSSCLLWVSADPGCGKSVLARYLVNEVLPKPSGRTVCYFFFNGDFDDQKSAPVALSCLIRQLLIAMPCLISDSILKKTETDGDKLIGSFQDLWNILMAVTSDPKAGEVVFVVDALDECCDADRSQLIDKVTDLYLQPDTTSNLKILLTSRPYGHIKSGFRKIEKQWPTIHLSGDVGEPAEQIAEEISLVVNDSIEAIAEEKELNQDERDFLRGQLAKIPNRTYLWVTLTLEFIRETPFIKGKVRRTLGEDIPATVNETYQKMLNRSSDHERARTLLHVILGARTPLSLEEVSVAIALQGTHKCEDDVKEEMESSKTFQNSVRDLCGLLLWINDGKIYLLHQTVKEFLVPRDAIDPHGLTWMNSFSATESQKVLAKRCIWFLHLQVSDPRLATFASYAATNWASHFRGSCFNETEDITMLALNFCYPDSPQFQSWRDHELKRIDKMPVRFRRSMTKKHWADFDIPPGTSPFILACKNGLQAVVQKLLNSQLVDCDSSIGNHITPLSYAVRNGYENVVQCLLDTGQVDVNSQGVDFGTPLSCAARQGNERLVQLLLDTGQVDVDPRDWQQKTPLSTAAGKGYDRVVSLLLGTGQAKVDSRDINQQTPLSWAALGGHENVIQLLLDTGQVDVNSRDNRQRTPLLWAALGGHEKAIQLLLNTRQVDIDSRDSEQLTPLSHAAQSGHERVVQLLLDTGQVDVDSRDNQQRTPLSHAAQWGHERVLQLLLDTGQVDVSSQHIEQRTALSNAAEEDHENMNGMLQFA